MVMITHAYGGIQTIGLSELKAYSKCGKTFDVTERPWSSQPTCHGCRISLGLPAQTIKSKQPSSDPVYNGRSIYITCRCSEVVSQPDSGEARQQVRCLKCGTYTVYLDTTREGWID